MVGGQPNKRGKESFQYFLNLALISILGAAFQQSKGEGAMSGGVIQSRRVAFLFLFSCWQYACLVEDIERANLGDVALHNKYK